MSALNPNSGTGGANGTWASIMSNQSIEFFNVNDTSNSTVTIIPANNQSSNRLLEICITSLTADYFTLVGFASGNIGPIYIGANSPFGWVITDGALITPNDTAITLTKGTSSTNVTCFGRFLTSRLGDQWQRIDTQWQSINTPWQNLQ
jgi:hypothetical protein